MEIPPGFELSLRVGGQTENHWPAILQAISLIVSTVSIYLAFRQTSKNAGYSYVSEILKLRIRQIEEFYAPISVRIEQSKILYDKLKLFVSAHNERCAPAKRIELDGFHLLDHIHHICSDEDFRSLKPTVDEILEIGESISMILEEKGGLIEGGLSETMYQYRAHFNLLHLASKHELSADQREGWKQFAYYPRILNREIREGYKRVQSDIDELKRASDKTFAKIFGAKVRLKKEPMQLLQSTLKYYEKNSESYAKRFDHFPLELNYTRFIAALGQSSPPSAQRILDAGCGAGRDVRYFIRRGHPVVALDISPAMGRLCKRKIRDSIEKAGTSEEREAALASEFLEKTFDEIDEFAEFSGVWCSAALLHLSTSEAHEAIGRFALSLKVQGILFCSVRYGHGAVEFDGRKFHNQTKHSLRTLIEKGSENRLRVETMWLTDSQCREVNWLELVINRFKRDKATYWVNCVAKKVSNIDLD